MSEPDARPPPPWLMIVDMQRVFGESDSPWFTPNFDGALLAASRLRPSFGSRIALTRFVPPAVPRGAWVEYYDRWPFALDTASAPRFDLVAGCRSEDAVVIERPTFSKWDADVARRLGADSLVIAGVSTDCCVLSTALAAADAGISVRIAADACAGTTLSSHKRALAAMALYAPHIEISDVDTILAEQSVALGLQRT